MSILCCMVAVCSAVYKIQQTQARFSFIFGSLCWDSKFKKLSSMPLTPNELFKMSKCYTQPNFLMSTLGFSSYYVQSRQRQLIYHNNNVSSFPWHSIYLIIWTTKQVLIYLTCMVGHNTVQYTVKWHIYKHVFCACLQCIHYRFSVQSLL